MRSWVDVACSLFSHQQKVSLCERVGCLRNCATFHFSRVSVKPSPVLVRLPDENGKHQNKFSASSHQLTAEKGETTPSSRGQLSFERWCTPSSQPSKQCTQQGGTKLRKGHPRSRGTPCLNCIKIPRKLTSQHHSEGLAAHVPSPF